MEVAAFPVMPDVTPLETALREMRRGHFGGVVIRRSDDLRLAETAQVRTAIQAGRQLLGQVEGAIPLFRPTIGQLGAADVDLVDPMRTQAAYESLLDAQGSPFGVLAAGPQHAIVFSRHEGWMAGFRNGPQDCYCVPNGHTNQGPPPPASCRRCGRPVRCDAP